MAIFISILFVLAAIIALILFFGLFVTKDFHIKRTVFINQPKEKVFAYIRMLNNQEYYNTWWMEEPRPKKTFKGTDGTVGFIIGWDNNKSQKGEQEIKKITEGEHIDFELRFEKPFKNVADTFMTTAVVAEGTNVTWGFKGKNKNPMNVIYKVFNLEKKLGNDMSAGLNRLKKVLETNN